MLPTGARAGTTRANSDLHGDFNLAGRLGDPGSLWQGSGAPWNRYLVRVDVSDDVWARREILVRPPAVGWDAIPEGLVSRGAGAHLVEFRSDSLLAVPSVIIVEEDNVLINPAHPDAKRIPAIKVRRFVYDHRV